MSVDRYPTAQYSAKLEMAGPRLSECYRQGQADVVSKSRNITTTYIRRLHVGESIIDQFCR